MGVEGETFKMEGDKAVYPELTDVPLVDISVLEDRYGLWSQGLYVNSDKRACTSTTRRRSRRLRISAERQ